MYFSDSKDPLNPFTARSSRTGAGPSLSGCGGSWVFEVGGREDKGFVAVPLPKAAPGGFAGLFFGRTNGSAAARGRRIRMGGAPFAAVGVWPFGGLVGVDMLRVENETQRLLQMKD